MNIRDISHEFGLAARYVAAGTLVKDDHFSLFEAVGALEIGDSKMDSGCLMPGETLDQDFDVEKELLPEELLWLMDELLSREVAWLMGYPLSQTLFTSVHIDRLLWPNPSKVEESTFVRGHAPEQLPLLHGVLRVYCLLVVKSCDLVLDMVVPHHYYEEEDFTTQLFNRELLHRFPSGCFSELVLTAIDAVIQSDYAPKLRDALSTRLRFRKDVLEMLSQHNEGQAPPSSLFSFMHVSLDQCRSTHALGIPVVEAFSTKLQRRLASTVPPRPMVTVSMDQVWRFWHNMLIDCDNVFAVRHSGHSQDLFTAYSMFAYSSPQPSTYPRALLQSFLNLDGLVASRLEARAFLEEDLQSLTLPASQLLRINENTFGRLYHGNDEIALSMQNFVDRFEHNFVNVYRALCLNSCRIRRTFCHALSDWDVLQNQAEEIDLKIQKEMQETPRPHIPGALPAFSFSLSSWVYHQKLTILRLTIVMGFEQMIYAPSELAGMYWYLSSICDVHLRHLDRISHFVTTKDSDFSTNSLPTEMKDQASSQCKHALDRLYHEYSWIKATQLLASALHSIFIVLQRYGISVAGQALYSTDAMRYDIRMKPFLGLSIPEPLSHEDYESEVRVEAVSTAALLDQAAMLSADAKCAWEAITKTKWNRFPKLTDSGNTSILDEKWNAEVKDCLKAAIAASLCVVNLKKVIPDKKLEITARQGMKLPDPGENGRWHRWWIIPALPPGVG